jgi:hypothetical protein
VTGAEPAAVVYAFVMGAVVLFQLALLWAHHGERTRWGTLAQGDIHPPCECWLSSKRYYTRSWRSSSSHAQGLFLLRSLTQTRGRGVRARWGAPTFVLLVCSLVVALASG